MRLVGVASGGSGNCIYMGSSSAHILMDADISNKRTEQGLNEVGIEGGELDGIVTTHEHSDHTKGLGVLARKHGVPIYSTRETLEEVREVKYLGEYPEELLKPIHPDVDFMIGDMEMKPFRIDHDAANPMACRTQCRRKSMAATADMGHFNQYIIDHPQGLDAILLESSHDVNILETGPHPYYLRHRILGDHGHLSNENAGKLLNYILYDNLKNTLLGHLSKENNYEGLAYKTVKLGIEQGDHRCHSADFFITMAKRDFISEIITI